MSTQPSTSAPATQREIERERERERERVNHFCFFDEEKKKRKKKEHILYNKKDEMSNDHINLKSHRVSIYPINKPNPITPLFD